MPITYEKAPGDVAEMLAGAMRRYHPHLVAADVTVAVLFADDVDPETGESSRCLKHQGYDAAAVMSITPLKHRALGVADALLVIDSVAWANLGLSERDALLDHELEHLRVLDVYCGYVSWDAEERQLIGHPRTDDLGRPKLKIKLHDIQVGGFLAVMKRHGAAALETQVLRRFRVGVERDQYVWDFAADHLEQDEAAE